MKAANWSYGIGKLDGISFGPLVPLQTTHVPCSLLDSLDVDLYHTLTV